MVSLSKLIQLKLEGTKKAAGLMMPVLMMRTRLMTLVTLRLMMTVLMMWTRLMIVWEKFCGGWSILCNVDTGG